jgi:hypothetical protein
MPPQISVSTIVRCSPKPLASELEGNVVLLDLETGLYYGFEGVGARVWGLLQDRRRVAEIRDALVQEYDVEPERCERDLLKLLDRAAQAGLIEVDSAAN